MFVERLSFYPQEAECTIICDYKSLEKVLKGKTESIEVNNYNNNNK